MLRPYLELDLSFAWSYVIYLRWKTHRNQPNPHLPRLDHPTLETIAQRYGIRVLEATTSSSEVILMASLKPDESVSSCASKLKGQSSKWLREAMALGPGPRLWSRSYFAAGIGKNTKQAVEAYLAKQPERHGYSERPHPPVFVKQYPLTDADDMRLQPKHGRTDIQLHVSLSTLQRASVFAARSGEALAAFWKARERDGKFALLKISIVPDHLHLALKIHPTVAPSGLVLDLMNSAQEFLFENHRDAILATGLPQIWYPGAYIGTYGEVTRVRVRDYIREWDGE